jgi:pre-mRNA-splicing factor ISY1
MARNSEKANLMFNRWTSLKEEESRGGPARPERRPHLASECRVLSEAEKWRRTIISEMTRAIKEIQNAGLGEARLRDLNDAINKLSRERRHWERQIKSLGGADHALGANALLEGEGSEATLGSRGGYRYYGAAKDLPGVKEILARGRGPAAAAGEKRVRGDAAKHLPPDYYGWRDEDADGGAALLRQEAEVETRARAAAVAAWNTEHAKKARGGAAATVAGAAQPTPAAAWEDPITVAAGKGGDPFAALWMPLPRIAAAAGAEGGAASGGGASSSSEPQIDIAAALAARRRELLRETYSSDHLSAQIKESASLVGRE